jgi:hypothetical protein
MLWQPSHSATPPEWNEYAVVLTPTATRAANNAKSVTFTIFIFSSFVFSPGFGEIVPVSGEQLAIMLPI